MFEAYGRNWLQSKEGFILRKNAFLVDYKSQECRAPSLLFVAACLAQHTYLVLQVGWVG